MFKLVIPELALPKKLLKFFGGDASSGIQACKNWIPDEVSLPKTKTFLDDANSGMTNLIGSHV